MLEGSLSPYRLVRTALGVKTRDAEVMEGGLVRGMISCVQSSLWLFEYIIPTLGGLSREPRGYSQGIDLQASSTEDILRAR